MRCVASSVAVAAFARVAFAATTNVSTACAALAGALSDESQVYQPASVNYLQDTKHYMTSSYQAPTCVIEIGSTADAAKVMKAIGTYRIPFAIQSGGHASNQGFSSTTGLHISTVRLDTVVRSADNSYVDVGVGNAWSDVYYKLEGSGYNTVGGRVSGPATGLTLGGGYSWKTNQHGLACDVVEQFTLVLPNGTVANIGPSQNDLFFALKGGLNRFGLVTSIRYKLWPQVPIVYGGYQLFGPEAIPALIDGTTKFNAENTDPKAQIILVLSSGANVPNSVLLTFYDGPTRPAAFAPFDGIVPLLSNVSSSSFSDLVSRSPSSLESGGRGAFHTLSTTNLTKGYIQAVYNESQFYGQLALLRTGVELSYDIEPFLTNFGQYATDSAWPHANSPIPLNLDWLWLDPLEDTYWRGLMKQSVNYLTEVAKREGIYSPDLYAYPNYAIGDLTGDQLYGPTNAAKLRAIRAQVDPDNVMGLTGGFQL